MLESELHLAELARRGSFTAAADALSYTQSAISQQISALERETGATLVERDRKRARLKYRRTSTVAASVRSSSDLWKDWRKRCGRAMLVAHARRRNTSV